MGIGDEIARCGSSGVTSLLWPALLFWLTVLGAVSAILYVLRAILRTRRELEDVRAKNERLRLQMGQLYEKIGSLEALAERVDKLEEIGALPPEKGMLRKEAERVKEES